MRGMGRLWQAAGTVKSVLTPGLVEKAAACGLRSLFIGFETVNPANLRDQHKIQNMNCDYDRVVRHLHDLGIMINASFVFGMDRDDPGVFGRTVDWALDHGIETATFHIMTPYPGTALFDRVAAQRRILHRDWDLYDTRHAVFRPARMSTETLEAGYWRAYRDFYRWGSIVKGARAHERPIDAVRHAVYAAGGVVPFRMGNSHPSLFPYEPLPTADGRPALFMIGQPMDARGFGRGLFSELY